MRSPRLLLVAVAEVLLVIVLSVAAWWCWQRGVIVTVRRGVEMTRVEGPWWASAVGAATLAGILLLDAGRRIVRRDSHLVGAGGWPSPAVPATRAHP